MREYSGARGFTPDQFREVAEQVAGASLADFWNCAVKGTGELPYAEALATFGLRFRAASAPSSRRRSASARATTRGG